MRPSHLITFISIVLLAAACGSTGSEPGPPDEGSLQIALSEVPSDVLCLVIRVKGTRAVNSAIPATPGQPVTKTLSGLPVGVVSVGAEAFAVGCAAVQADSVPTWVSDPVMATLVPGQTALVKLTMKRNGQIKLDVDWQEDPLDASVVDTGADGAGEVDVASPDAGSNEADAAAASPDTGADEVDAAAASPDTGADETDV